MFFCFFGGGRSFCESRVIGSGVEVCTVDWSREVGTREVKERGGGDGGG